MARGLRGWTYKDVVKFLKKKGFYFYEHREGSHEAWINLELETIVEIQFHGDKTTIVQRTLETMIRQSGISKGEWRNR